MKAALKNTMSAPSLSTTMEMGVAARERSNVLEEGGACRDSKRGGGGGLELEEGVPDVEVKGGNLIVGARGGSRRGRGD